MDLDADYVDFVPEFGGVLCADAFDVGAIHGEVRRHAQSCQKVAFALEYRHEEAIFCGASL